MAGQQMELLLDCDWNGIRAIVNSWSRNSKTAVQGIDPLYKRSDALKDALCSLFCYLLLLSRGNCSSDNGGLELPAVIFRIKVPPRREQWAFHIDLSHSCQATTCFHWSSGKRRVPRHCRLAAGGGFGGNIGHQKPAAVPMCATVCQCVPLCQSDSFSGGCSLLSFGQL